MSSGYFNLLAGRLKKTRRKNRRMENEGKEEC
jgi:hypothetical protein